MYIHIHTKYIWYSYTHSQTHAQTKHVCLYFNCKKKNKIKLNSIALVGPDNIY